MAAIVLAVVVSCTKANPYEGLSLVLSGVPENMTVGESAQVSVAFSGASSAAATYKWMSLNPTVVCLKSQNCLYFLKAMSTLGLFPVYPNYMRLRLQTSLSVDNSRLFRS